MDQPQVVVRRLGAPGDLGWVIQAHGEIYAAEFGWDTTFEALVARIVADFANDRDSSREAGWIAERDGVRVGCVFCVAEDDDTAGLRVVYCSDANDARWMLRQAVRSDDPVIFYEPKRRYWAKAEVTATSDPARVLPLDRARVVRRGRDLTLFSYGGMVRVCLDAAEAAAAEGRELEVIDLRSLSPLDTPTLVASVIRTRRAVVVHEAPTFLGPGAELAAQVTERCFYHLEAPVLRVGGYNLPYPPARLEDHYLPDIDRVLAAVDRALAF